MNTFQYTIACRTCLKADLNPKIFIDFTDDYENLGIRTEYSAANYLLNLRGFENSNCQYCNSSNLQIEDVVFNDEKLFDEETIDYTFFESPYSGVFILNIDKVNGEINYSTNAKSIISKRYLKAALLEALHFINDINTSLYQPHDKGTFYICMVGECTDFEDSIFIHKHVFAGLEKNTILQCIVLVAESCNLNLADISIPQENLSFDKSRSDKMPSSKNSNYYERSEGETKDNNSKDSPKRPIKRIDA